MFPRAGGMGSDCLMATVSFWDDDNVLDRDGSCTNVLIILNGNELFTVKWLILDYVNFTSILKTK